MPTLAIIGAGGQARVVADAARASGRWHRIVFFDETFPRERTSGDWPLLGTVEELHDHLSPTDTELLIGSGDNRLRSNWHRHLAAAGWCFATLIHPTAIVSEGCRIGSGSVILAGAVLNHGCRIGEDCIINTRAVVEHDCRVDNAVHLSPGAVLCGKVTVGDHSWIGAGSVVIPGRTIGRDAIVGAGASVIDDLPDRVTAVGCPARMLPVAAAIAPLRRVRL